MRRPRSPRRLLLGSLGAGCALGFLGLTPALEPPNRNPGASPPPIRLVQKTDTQAQPPKPAPTAQGGSDAAIPLPMSQLPGTGPGAETAIPLPASLFGPAGGPATSGQVTDPGRAPGPAPATNLVGGAQAVMLGSTDAGDLLGRSTSATGVETQKRSPIANEARIRGYRLAEITTHADGAFWFPARLDLDTFLSKIDSGIVEDVIVVKGPYSARYGPGFSFLDIATLGSPRFDAPFEWHGRTYSNYKLNGEQFAGRQSFWGGSSDWGVRVSYGHRTGNDYRTGAGLQMPSSYNARDAELNFGYDFSPVSRLEIGYMRIDQTNLEFPGQVFDTNFLVTDGVRLRYVLEQQQYFDRFVMDSWYNYTRLAGDNLGQGKRRQVPELAATNFIGRTDIDLGSLGYRLAMTWGESKCPQLTVGTDLRRLNGHLNEFDSLLIETFGNVLPCGDVNFPVPRSHQTIVGGLFVEYLHPYQDHLVVKVGARGDYSNQDIDKKPPPGFTCEQFQDISQALIGTGTDFEREFGLWLAYATADYKLTDHWTVVGGLGHAERPPTTTELYALEPFLAILQQGFTSVRGNIGLEPERLWQIDIGLRADYQYFRAGFNTFCALIQDYITYAAVGRGQKGIAFGGSLGADALTVQFVNTDLATLAGFEVYTEFDYTDNLTPFMTVSYVQGRDHSRSARGATNLGPGVGGLGANQEPLPGIPPLDCRMGLRFHEARPQPRWGLELGGRFVASQDRVASSLNEQRSSGFAVYDVRSFWKARQGLTLTAGVENVFDRNYREHLDLLTGLGVFQPGINGYFGVELRY